MAQRFFLIVVLSAFASASGQTAPPRALSATALPESPSALRAAQSSIQTPAPQTGTASISGQVEDFTGAAVPGALIKLDAPSGPDKTTQDQTITADAVGAFHFSNLPPGIYRVTATAPDMSTYVSAEIRLNSGESLELTKIALAVGSTHTDVQVIADPAEIASEQVHEEERQRVLGILPNFYSSYIWDAAPLTSKQKYGLALHSIFDPFSFVGAGIGAGIEQANNTYPAYGQGAQGYGKRFGAGFADQATSRIIGSAILPSILHQDPRYFYKGTGTTRARFFYAIRSAVVTRGDNGHAQPNYSSIFGAFASGAISYSYHPAADRSAGLVLGNGFLQLAGHAGDDLIREFILLHLTPHVPAYKKGQPPASDKL